MAQITLKEVAANAGVSVQTVSHILNDLPDKPYKQDTRDRVIKVARKLGYRPNAAARSMVMQKTRNVGLIMQARPDAWFNSVDAFEIMLGLNATLAPNGFVCSVIPVVTFDEPGSESRVFREQVLDGVVVCGHASEDVCARIEKSIDLCIWVDTNINRPHGCIRRDEFHNSYLAASRMAELGYRKLIWMDFAVHWNHYSHADRLAGFQQAVREFGLDSDTIACTEPWIGISAERLRKVLNPDVAVIASRDHFAMSLTHLMRHENMRPGYDFGLVALDQSHECSRTWPGLSTVVTDRTRIGEMVARMFLQASGKTHKLPASMSIQGHWHAGETAWGPRR